MVLEFLDSVDLKGAHFVASLLGVGLALYVMQLWGHGSVAYEHFVVNQLRRTSLIILALALLWSLSYAEIRQWQPWPSDLLTVIAVDIFLLSTVISSAIQQYKRKTRIETDS